MKLVKTLIFGMFLALFGRYAVAVNPAKTPAHALKSTHRAYKELAGALLPIEADVPSGCFQMGSPESELGRSENETQHRVCLNGFKISRYEATMAEFKNFIQATGYVTDAGRNQGQLGCWSYQTDAEFGFFRWDWWPKADWAKPLGTVALSGNHPVSCVSFNDVMAYVAWLNKQTGRNYRLPTEAEWEYAARAGTTTARFWGNNAWIACSYANVADNSRSEFGHWPVRHRCQDGSFFASEAGAYHANAFTLHDMIGNVWEWTCSSYEENYNGRELGCFQGKAKFDTLIAIRGGGWNADTARVRAAHRNWGASWSRQANLGFRLVRGGSPSKLEIAP